MSTKTFDVFIAELVALGETIRSHPRKTIRDAELLDRLRNLYRTWNGNVKPSIEGLLNRKHDLLKLEAEVEALAKLTSKYKPVAVYQKHIKRAMGMANDLVMYLPCGDSTQGDGAHKIATKLFLSDIPDLPLSLVPNSLIGWRSNMKAFLSEFPFDRSVFIMIRYRDHTAELIGIIKKTLSQLGYNGIVASDHNITDDLYNPIACLLCCARGVAVFDKAEEKQVFNPNVAYELGMMHLLGRECRILKHSNLQVLHTDILMKLYKPYSDTHSAGILVDEWLGNEA